MRSTIVFCSRFGANREQNGLPALVMPAIVTLGVVLILGDLRPDM